VDLLVSTLGGMDCILGMEFITRNNVLIEVHDRLVKIPSKNGIVRMKAHKVPNVSETNIKSNVSETNIHLMLGKTFERECVGSYGMLCVMQVLDEFEPKEATKVVSLHKCIKQVLNKFSDVMPEELLDELPPRRQVDHVIKVMLEMAPPAKAPYRMNHEK
jgi:hypothetical protein